MKSLVSFIIVIIAAVFFCTAADASRAVSPRYTSIEAAIQSSPLYYNSETTGDLHITCKAQLEPGDGFVWYVQNSFCVRIKQSKTEAFFTIDEKVNKGKEISARFQYNLIDGQTLYRDYVLASDKESGDVLFLTKVEDVVEFVRLSEESAIVMVTYNISQTESKSIFFPM